MLHTGQGERRTGHTVPDLLRDVLRRFDLPVPADRGDLVAGVRSGFLGIPGLGGEHADHGDAGSAS